MDVAQKLLNAGIREEDIITAALLHDLTEDVLDEKGKPVYSISKIEKMFNSNVAYMVELVTKEPDVDYKANKEELGKYLNRISEHYGASLIKTSDRLHNMQTLLDADNEKRIRQAIETEGYFIPFFKKCRNAYPWYAAFFFEAKTIVEPQIQMIKEYYDENRALKEEVARLKSQIKND